MSEAQSDPSTHLQPPHKTTEVEDPGAEDVASASISDDEHFSDASEGQGNDQSSPQSGRTSPVPQTRVERVDSSVRHGEVPGTSAYEKRKQDAVPDAIEVIPEGAPSVDHSHAGLQDRPLTPGGSPIPQTMAEQTDIESPSHGEAPRTDAVGKRQTDATIPDMPLSQDGAQAVIEDTGAGDDFDEFVEEQDEMGDDDFGDFDDGFQEPGEDIADEGFASGGIDSQQPSKPLTVPPLTDFDAFNSTSELHSALQGTLDQLLPSTKDLDTLPLVEDISDSSAIFSSERSLSLWSQLVAPPPLQPQNWVKSRIRRLFLVSLGVPVDLDEILPASKQKKLILPSIDLDSSGATTPRNAASKEGDGSQNATTTSGQAPARSKTTRRGAPPPPELDLSAVRRLCATTDAALGGLTDTELKQHVTELEQVTLRASAVLENWLKRRDGLVGEKEAFEGVIENLVSHVRRVRK